MSETRYAALPFQGTVVPPPARRARPRMDIHDAMACMSIALAVLLADNLRAAGGVGYFFCVLLAGLSLGRNIPRKTVRDASAFAIIVLSYCFLSYLHMLPRGWTAFYERGAIFRQSMPLIGFCVMLVAYHRFWGRLLAGKFSDKVLWWILAVLFIGPFFDLAIGSTINLRIASTLRNSLLIFLAITSYMAWSRRGGLIVLLPLVYLIFGAVTSYSQTRGFYAIAAVLLWAYSARLNFSRNLVLILVSASVLITAITLLTFNTHDFIELYYSDYNTAWRLLFWRDVFRSAVMTYGIGVGFGTEALANYYPNMPKPVFILDPAQNPDFIMTGSHNAFTDALLRCGLPGFLALSWIFLSSAQILRRRYNPAVAISFCGAFLCAFVNVALQSPLYSIGIAFALGLCRAQLPKITIGCLEAASPASNAAAPGA